MDDKERKAAIEKAEEHIRLAEEEEKEGHRIFQEGSPGATPEVVMEMSKKRFAVAAGHYSDAATNFLSVGHDSRAIQALHRQSAAHRMAGDDHMSQKIHDLAGRHIQRLLSTPRGPRHH